MRPRIAGRAHGLARPVLCAAFALANLEAVEALERATGRDTVLTAYAQLDARTGHVQHANFTCLHVNWHSCSGPGVY
jgi:hypothetical protein